MTQPPINYTRSIKYTINPSTGRPIRLNTRCKAGERPGVATDVYEVRDIPPNVTDQQVLAAYNAVDTYWYTRIKIYSYPYEMLANATAISPLPTVKEHLEAIMAHKQATITQVVEYLAVILGKTPKTLWGYWTSDKAPRDTIIAINSIAWDILEGRLWTVD